MKRGPVGEGRHERLFRLIAAGLLGAVAALGWGAVTGTLHSGDAIVGIPLTLAAFALGSLYRAFRMLSQRHASLEMLYDFTRSLDRSTSTERSMRDILRRTAELLRSERAGLVLLNQDGTEGGIRRWIDAEGTLHTENMPAVHEASPLNRVLTAGVPALVAVDRSEPDLTTYLERKGVRDAAIVPLRSDIIVIGALWVADSRDDTETFDAADMRLLETVASQISNVLDNSRLLDQLRHDSLHDALTGLANRMLYQDTLRQALSASQHVGVLLMDLDRFKEINDTLGHYHGDLLISELAERIVGSAPPGTTVARLGGDEFALLIADADRTEVERAAQIIRTAISQPCVVEGVSIDVSASVGIAISPDDGHNESVLLKCADMAMYAAKASGTGIQFYDSTRDEYSPRRLSLASGLRDAIGNGELLLHYQPQVTAATGEVVGLEALVRWDHPVYGLVPPIEFVTIAEQSGAISDLTRFVLTTAVEQMVAWREEGYELGISVNISMRNLLDASVPDLLTELRVSNRLPAGGLTLELTESHLMADPERTLPILRRLAEQGVRISIDDFGTGYSSFAYLRQLPVHEVKIDKSFVREVSENPGETAIVRAIVTLAESLGLDTVAEGVEDANTVRALTALGCTRLQGYHISRPQPAADVHAWLGRRPQVPHQTRRLADLHVVPTRATG